MMFPPVRPKAKPFCWAGAADGVKATARTSASRIDRSLIRVHYAGRVRRAALLLVPLVLAACGGGGSSAQSGPPAQLLHPEKLTGKAPQLFDVKFVTTKGDFTITVHRTWAPRGA